MKETFVGKVGGKHLEKAGTAPVSLPIESCFPRNLDIQENEGTQVGAKCSPGSPTLVGETLSLEIIDRVLRAGLERVYTHKPRYLVG